jgi:hypothetical protein
MMLKVLFALLGASGVLSPVPPFLAQNAQLSGRVADRTGAVIAHARVAVTREDTGVNRALRTNNAGAYRLLRLMPGTYKVSAQLPCFETFVGSDVSSIVERRGFSRASADA